MMPQKVYETFRMDEPRRHHPPTRPLNSPPRPTALRRHNADGSSIKTRGTTHDPVKLRRKRHPGSPQYVLAACALVR
ncbi:hypothetical protein BU14_0326s0013 [Porphyra umbilicalis]|uniref:Uncharacterized protein n=1 Tax=Porphyra umbilicalis TaxID=2786 RepID=A0A1X6NYW9_PORUM|nr:hypothetical protein BU14_0326s0013 [Porphyra umbilicalis]|eukprot:OSX73819.1 hypothetical protein BU14_0326s0013 [Porphyra umbilicalis]